MRDQNQCARKLRKALFQNIQGHNVQIVGLVVDVGSLDSEEYQDALKILSKSGATFTTIVTVEAFADLYEQLIGVPTTMFVGPDGKILASEIIGADMDSYKKTVESLL